MIKKTTICRFAVFSRSICLNTARKITKINYSTPLLRLYWDILWRQSRMFSKSHKRRPRALQPIRMESPSGNPGTPLVWIKIVPLRALGACLTKCLTNCLTTYNTDIPLSTGRDRLCECRVSSVARNSGGHVKQRITIHGN